MWPCSLLEMCTYPLYIDAAKQCIKYWFRINIGEVNEILACITNSQSCNDDRTWTFRIKQFLTKYGYGRLGYLWLQKSDDESFYKYMLLKIMFRLKDCTLLEFFSSLKSQSKVRTYLKYKSIYEMCHTSWIQILTKTSCKQTENFRSYVTNWIRQVPHTFTCFGWKDMPLYRRIPNV